MSSTLYQLRVKPIDIAKEDTAVHLELLKNTGSTFFLANRKSRSWGSINSMHFLIANSHNVTGWVDLETMSTALTEYRDTNPEVEDLMKTLMQDV